MLILAVNAETFHMKRDWVEHTLTARSYDITWTTANLNIHTTYKFDGNI